MADSYGTINMSTECFSTADDSQTNIDKDTFVMNSNTNIPTTDSATGEAQGHTSLENFEENEIILEDEQIDDLSTNGVLDKETISKSLANLSRSACGTYQVYLHCSMPGFNLKDISLLAEYVYLQKLDLSYNDVTDLSALSSLENLIILDASHNQISELLDFKPPKNLMTVDLSFNNIVTMSDLSEHHYLQHLILNNNMITGIDGLSNCRRLTYLSLAHNQIDSMAGINRLPIQHLNLSHNNLSQIDNIDALPYLRHADLSSNSIQCLAGLEGHDILEHIDLENNNISGIEEITSMLNLRMLRELNLLGNPMQELPESIMAILYRLPCLTKLNKMKVSVEEKVLAKNMFKPPDEVVASRDHAMNVVYGFLQPNHVWDSTLPNVETVYPMLVLLGPPGCGKRALALKLSEEFSDFFGYGVPDTTRAIFPGEDSSRDFNYVSLQQFESDIRAGQFILTYENNGDWYGLQMEAVECVAREGLACVVHMELEGVMSLKNTYFEPRYVLIVPNNKEVHEQRLRKRQGYTEEQIEQAIKKSEEYSDYNEAHPGFFDMMLSEDDLQGTYNRLRRLVMDYLGIGSLSPDSAYEDKTVVFEDETHVPHSATTTSNNMTGARTWSKLSGTDTASQCRGKITSPSVTGRGIVEAESLKRRFSAARDVVSGSIPPLYEMLLTGYPKTAPQSVKNQVGLGETDPRAYSAPVHQTMGTIPGGTPDSSVEGGNSSRLSDLGSASEMQRGDSPQENNSINPLNVQLPTERVNPLDFMSEQGYRTSSQQMAEYDDGRPSSAARDSCSRPGSDRHKVLPPIATPTQLSISAPGS